MKKYIYACPRCGRQWVRFIPRSKMKCPFCSETWHTRGRRSTRSRFSWTATFLWLFWIALIAGVAVGHRQIVDFGTKFIQSHPIIKPKPKSNKGATVPPIKLKPPREIIKEQELREAEEKEREREENAENAENAAQETGVEGASSSEQTPDVAPDLELDPIPGE